MALTIAGMCDGVAATLSAAVGLARTQSLDELTEDYPDLPLLQVYPETGQVDIIGSTDRSSFRGGTRVGEYGITADVIVAQRSHLGENMALAATLVEAVTTVLENERVRPYFGLEGVKAFRWQWQRTLFLTGDPAFTYVGARFTITLTTF